MHTLRYLWYRMKHRVIRRYEYLPLEMSAEIRWIGLHHYQVLLIDDDWAYDSVVRKRANARYFWQAKSYFNLFINEINNCEYL